MLYDRILQIWLRCWTCSAIVENGKKPSLIRMTIVTARPVGSNSAHEEPTNGRQRKPNGERIEKKGNLHVHPFASERKPTRWSRTNARPREWRCDACRVCLFALRLSLKFCYLRAKNAVFALILYIFIVLRYDEAKNDIFVSK